MITRILLALSLCVCFNTPTFAGNDSGLKGIFDAVDKLTCEQATTLFRDPRASTSVVDDSIDGQYLQRIVEVYAVLNRCALNKFTRRELYDGLLQGMVATLKDPHSEYINAEDFRKFTERTSGQFVGIGVTLTQPPNVGSFNALKVAQPLPGAPADKAGLKSGDMITKINDRFVSSYSTLDEALKDIRGTRGSTLNLFVTREGVLNPFTIAIVRDEIKAEFQKSTVLPNKWFHVQIDSFNGEYVPGTRTLVLCADIQSAYKKALLIEPNLKGAILDLRDNRGGAVNGARCVVDLFAPESLRGKALLSVETRDGLEQYSSEINPLNILQGKPLIVLVNGNSASASEIVAKAAQYYDFGVVVGTKTYGKGSMQMVLPLADAKTALRFTFAQYLVGSTSAPTPVQGVGVTPNILATQSPNDPAALHEKELPGTLPTSTVAKDIVVKDTKVTDPALYAEIISVIASEPFTMKVEEVLMP